MPRSRCDPFPTPFHSADPTVYPMPHSHLSDERLAELAEVPGRTPGLDDEAAHLADCSRCRIELDAHRALIARAGTLGDAVAAPLSDWSRLAPVLRAEGLLAPGPATSDDPADRTVRPLTSARAERWRPPAAAWRAVAAVLVLAAGLVGGRISAGASPLPAMNEGAGAAQRVATILADSAPAPASSEEAMAVLTRAERDYRLATAFLAAQSAPGMGADRPEVYQRRLAVMDEVAALTRAALAESPHDPVLNQYYLASLGAREATLQSLATALPDGAQLRRF